MAKNVIFALEFDWVADHRGDFPFRIDRAEHITADAMADYISGKRQPANRITLCIGGFDECYNLMQRLIDDTPQEKKTKWDRKAQPKPKAK